MTMKTSLTSPEPCVWPSVPVRLCPCPVCRLATAKAAADFMLKRCLGRKPA